MLKATAPCKHPHEVDPYQARINYGTKIWRCTLGFSGLVLTLVQVVKALLAWQESGSLSFSIGGGLVIGLLLIVLAQKKLSRLIVSKLAARSRTRRFQFWCYLFPIVLALSLLLLKIQVGHDSAYWQSISDEGGISEYGTAIAYLLVPFFAIPLAQEFRRRNQPLMAFCYFGLVLGSIFVSLEEISWGQRLIGFETTGFWAEHNVQDEFTFHNLSFFQEHLLDQSFLVLGLLGSCSWLLLHRWRTLFTRGFQLDLTYLIPNWPISSFFYPVLIFYGIHLFTDKLGFFITKDQEHCEFIMSLGILLFVILNFLRQVPKSPPQQEKSS